MGSKKLFLPKGIISSAGAVSPLLADTFPTKVNSKAENRVDYEKEEEINYEFKEGNGWKSEWEIAKTQWSDGNWWGITDFNLTNEDMRKNAVKLHLGELGLGELNQELASTVCRYARRSESEDIIKEILEEVLDRNSRYDDCKNLIEGKLERVMQKNEWKWLYKKSSVA